MKSPFSVATAAALIAVSAANGAVINSIKYEGLIHLSPTVAGEISGLKIGTELTAKDANTAVKNLYKQGYFSDIKITEDKGVVTIHFTEKPTIAKIDIEGVVTNDQKAIGEIIGIKKGQVYDEIAIKNASERVRQFYEARGYFDTLVSVEEEKINDGSIRLIIQINRGENITIKKVHLIGASVLDYDDIEPLIANKSREWAGWMWGRNDGKVKIFELPNDANKIRDEYNRLGYLDATVSNGYLNSSFDNYTAELVFYIDEGEQYSVDSISIDAPESLGLNTDKIIKSLKLKSGDKLNASWIQRDTQKLENMVFDMGYAYARIIPQTQKTSSNTANIIYKVIPEEIVKINNIQISGNDRTNDRVVRREMFLTEGDIYNKSDLVDSKNALKRSGYFEDVEIKEKRIDKETMDLEVAVKETSTGTITGGIGYGTGDGLLLNAGVSDTNVFGTGYQGTFSIDKSDDYLSGTISLTNPRVFDSQYSLGGSLFANEYEWDDYTEQNYGFSLTAGRQIGRYTNVYLTYLLQQSDITGLNAFYREAGYLNGKNIKSAITPGISFNNTDDYYIPRSGIIASTSLEYAGAGGDMNFLKSNTSFNLYYGLNDLIDVDLILRYKASFGYIWSDDDKNLPINERLFLGGIRSLRGFDSRSVSPRKLICNPKSNDGTSIIQGCQNIDTGGKIAFNNSAELSFPIIDRIKMRGVLFFDYGMIGDKNLNEIKRYSTGAGIEWITPIGPLQLFITKPLNDEPGDDTTSFEFTIGRRF